MIIRGENIGKNKCINENSKIFIKLLNDIENSDLMAMDAIDLLTIINQGIFTDNKIFREIYGTEPFSEERRIKLQNIKSGKIDTDNIYEETEYNIDDEEHDSGADLDIKI